MSIVSLSGASSVAARAARSGLVAVVVTVLAATACGGGQSATESVAEETDRPTSFDDFEYRSPIAELIGFDLSDRDAMETEFAEMERRGEQAIAECMQAEGFDYTPRDTSDMISFAGDGGDGLAYYSSEWIDKYGFGVSTQMFSQSDVGPDLVGFPDEEMIETAIDSDPNQEYLESLSEGEREAYQEALWGHPPDISSMTEEELAEVSFQPSGCQGKAFEEVFEAGPGGIGKFYELFEDDLTAMEQRAEADPRVVEYHNRVSECVTDAGYSWDPSKHPWEQLGDKTAALHNNRPGLGPGDPFEEAGLDPDEMSDREIDEFFRNLDRLDDDQRAQLGIIQAEEIELAKVVVGCDGGELNEAWFLQEIRLEYEQDFIDANSAALAEFSDGS